MRDEVWHSMRKLRFLTFAYLAFAVCTAALPLSASAQFGKPKEPQDHTRTLNGRVFDRQDNPIPKAVVYLKNTKTLTVKTYITEADGSYHFPALSPNADYEIYAEHNGARSDTKTLSAFDNRKLVNITLHVK